MYKGKKCFNRKVFKGIFVNNTINFYLCPKLKPHSLEWGRNITAFNFGAQKIRKDSSVQEKNF